MLNRGEKSLLCSIIADWEYPGKATSISEAMAFGECARTIINMFSLEGEFDLTFFRVLAVLELFGISRDDELEDNLIDFIDDNGYKAFVDKVEESKTGHELIKAFAT